MISLVCGVGFNDGMCPARVNKKISKEYKLWRAMLVRCYNQEYKNNHITYSECFVSDFFKVYSNFYKWCSNQIGFNKIGWDLDKDILSKESKMYGRDTCAFVPSEINRFFIDRKNDRGDFPLGVVFNKKTGKYRARCNKNGQSIELGFFNTPEDAFAVYKKFKEALCKELANKWREQIDPRVYDAMMFWEVSL